MKSRALRLLTIAVCLIGPVLLAAQSGQVKPLPPVQKPGPVQPQEIHLLTPQARVQMVGTKQVFKGYYSDVSVPMIVDDINRMSVRMPLPAGSYILLDGPISAGVHFGDKVEAQGTVLKPTAQFPKQLRMEQTILRLDAQTQALKVVTKASIKPVPLAPPHLGQQIQTAASRYKIKPDKEHRRTDYAILINGGVDWANYWLSFYNDLVIDYNMLVGRGYDPHNIIVLNADGSDSAPANKDNLAPIGALRVDGAATAAGVRDAFKKIAARIKSNDTLCVLVTDHGGPNSIGLWGESMFRVDFAALVNDIPPCYQMTFLFDICHSGGFIPYLQGPNRIIYAACDADNSAFNSSRGPFGALTSAFVAAMSGVDPCGGSANADENHNAAVSMAEAFNYILKHLDANETPHYNDDDKAPDVTKHLPQGSDGKLGANRYL